MYKRQTVEELEALLPPPPMERERQQPVRVRKIEPNQRVSVQYLDGRVERDVKFKKVEDDVRRGLCVVME